MKIFCLTLFTPTSGFMTCMTFNSFLESVWAKIQKIIAESSYKAKILQIKIAQIATKYTFLESPLTQRIQLCTFKILKTYMCIQEKLKICQLPLKACVQKLCNLLAFVKGFLKNYKMFKSNNWKYV